MTRRGGPNRAGFVLAGGGSTRMGRDKALLPAGGETLLDRTAKMVCDAAGSVTVIGPPARYASLGYPVVADKVENCGPLGGVYTALAITEADWNLIVACDMPELTADLLETLFRAAESSSAAAIVPESAGGLDPLCAVYHRRCAAPALAAIRHKIFKMHDFLSTLPMARLRLADPGPLRNVNTPADWTLR